MLNVSKTIENISSLDLWNGNYIICIKEDNNINCTVHINGINYNIYINKNKTIKGTLSNNNILKAIQNCIC